MLHRGGYFMINKKKLWRTADDHNIEDRVKKIKEEPVPEHIAIIMDGNGRWAKKELFPELPVIMKE